MRFMNWHFSSQNEHATRGRAATLLFFTLCLILLISLHTIPVRAESSEATAVNATFGIEYAVPNGPRNLVAEAPGRIWYTATDAGGIGFLEVVSSPDDPNVRYRTEFYGLGEKSQPYDLVYVDGVVWFTLRGTRGLGRIDVVTREIKTFTLLSVGAAPTGIAAGADGKLWIAQSNGRISRFDTTTEKFKEFVMPAEMTKAPRMEDVAYQNERGIWFTMPDANLLITYDAVRDRFFSTPTQRPTPMQVAIDPDGTLWITVLGSSQVGRYTPTTLSIWVWYDTPSPNGGPVGILIYKEQGVLQLWLTENTTGTIGRLQITNGFAVANSEKLGPNTPAGNTWGITRAPDGHIWVADPGRNLLYELTEPFVHRNYLATITTAQISHN